MNTLSSCDLCSLRRKGFRNGNWRKLNHIERALYMASLSLAKMRGRIVNSRLILQLRGIMGKLRETDGERMMLTAYQRAMRLYDRYMVVGLFKWAPQVTGWFTDQSYIWCLGLSTTTQFCCD
jgi:hypothetical protein